MHMARLISIGIWLLPLVPAARAQAPAESPGVPWEGELTGTNVRVRSGAGLDFYPTTKLHTGDRVLVFGEKLGWYRIAPPADSFSYIDMAEVERRPGDRHGIVRRDGVFVRAGSHLVGRKSSTQMTLNKGARVEIIGEADGFYKILPPRGAFLYISRDYVKPVPKRLRTGLAERYAAGASLAAPSGKRRPPPRPRVADARTTPRRPAAPAGRAPGAPRGARPPGAAPEGPPLQVEPSLDALKGGPAAPGGPGAGSARTASAAGADVPAASFKARPGRYQALLTAIESDFAATMRLPLKDRDLDTLIDRYREIADQEDEAIPAQYAKIRIEQLTNLSEIRRASARWRSQEDELDAFRSRIRAERMKIIRARADEAAKVKYDLEGELRQSYAFAPEKRRYRLVDPKRLTTIAYVEVPRTVLENAESMFGRLVGIRVSGQRFSTAARIPIAVASSITDLTPRPAGPAIIREDSSNRPNTPNRMANSSDEKTGPRSPGPDAKTAVAAGKEGEEGDE